MDFPFDSELVEHFVCAEDVSWRWVRILRNAAHTGSYSFAHLQHAMRALQSSVKTAR